MNTSIIILLIIFSFKCACSQENVQLRYDGIYQTESFQGYRTFLRFYENGDVLYVASSGEVNDLKKWFHKDNYIQPGDVRGNYTLIDSHLKFTLSSIEGKVIYTGKVENELNLTFKTKSLINGKESVKIFNFIEF